MIDIEKRIKVEDCEHRKLYKIIARNLLIGVWDEECQMFYGIREKFGSRFIDHEYHWDAPSFATCQPIEMIGKLPAKISLYNPNGDNKLLFDWLEEQEKIHAPWQEEKAELIRAELQNRKK